MAMQSVAKHARNAIDKCRRMKATTSARDTTGARRNSGGILSGDILSRFTHLSVLFCSIFAPALKLRLRNNTQVKYARPKSNTQGDVVTKRSVSGRCSRWSRINKHYNTPFSKRGLGAAPEFGNIADAQWKRANRSQSVALSECAWPGPARRPPRWQGIR